jgi:hypothetical protein
MMTSLSEEEKRVNNKVYPPAQPFRLIPIIPADILEFRQEDQPCGVPDQQKPLKKHSAVQKRWDSIG